MLLKYRQYDIEHYNCIDCNCSNLNKADFEENSIKVRDKPEG